ncbi:two-component sensor histidine kinase [Alkaliphilus metalliredigens QYMF]|uniref:Two-component sensor histidine kinase n=1 Tax=Alkaliphilus metalliredigens (strain QYMF) TaxID=293826 RepID=A6TNH3_ALKMQ|nr:histidine kinase [Alkaliphilus metalliredigens]ABR47741.1 two-component sensor histidine kinase [Alkaliphilus metalliredigens QYMF]
MDKRTKFIFDILTLITITVVCLISVLGNHEKQINILTLSIVLVASFLFRTFIVYEKKSYDKFKVPSILMELLIVLLILSHDTTNVSQIYLIILIVDAVFYYSLRFSIIFTLIGYLFFAWRNFYHYHFIFENTSDFLLTVFINGLGFTFLFSVIYFLKLQIQQKQLLAETMKELEYKNNKLKETSKALEEVALIKERNRIAHEIHDTVGHTLTTVLIEMEACKRLIDVDREL